MAVWITKHTLAQEGVGSDAEPGVACADHIKITSGERCGNLFFGDWHTTKEADIAKAEERQVKK